MQDDRYRDKELNINTTGRREFPDPKNQDINATESTDYTVLDKIRDQYILPAHSCLVDVGCGKGRVLFYAQQYENITVTGIEANLATFNDLTCNLDQYLERFQDRDRDAFSFFNGLIQNYAIQPQENVFYLFNPFSLRVFKPFVFNLLDSKFDNDREIDLLLYYALPEFIRFLDVDTPFKCIQEIDIDTANDSREVVLVYRY